MRVAGIDWSLSSPAICIYDENSVSFFSFAKSKKQIGSYSTFRLYEKQDFKTNQDRFDELTEWAMTIIRQNQVEVIFIEDYAFAANGRITDIAECVGVLKHKIYHQGMLCVPVTPSSVKKFATGKGNAKKFDMLDAFEKECSTDFYTEIGVERSEKDIPSPIQDLVDSYWVARYGKTQIVS